MFQLLTNNKRRRCLLKNWKRKWFDCGGILAIISGLLLMISCSGEKILQSNDQFIADDLGAINAVDLAKRLDSAQAGLAKTESSTYLIAQTQYGFEINGSAYTASFVLDNETITIKVPNNNFDKSKWGDRLYIFIRAEKWNTPNGLVYYYDCTPSGVVFSSPLMLIQPYENKIGGIQNLYWKNDRLNAWVVEDAQNLQSGYARFGIDHFSKYAIAD